MCPCGKDPSLAARYANRSTGAPSSPLNNLTVGLVEVEHFQSYYIPAQGYHPLLNLHLKRTIILFKFPARTPRIHHTAGPIGSLSILIRIPVSHSPHGCIQQNPSTMGAPTIHTQAPAIKTIHTPNPIPIPAAQSSQLGNS